MSAPAWPLIVSIGEPMIEFNQTRPGEREYLQGFGGDTSNMAIAAARLGARAGYVTRVGDEIVIEARARSFLHHQVRNMVGTLKLVGAGKWRVAHVAEALAARDRRAGGPTAPPEGLYLVEVMYAPG